MNQKILCVDDDSNILRAFQRNLRKEFEITTAESGAQGLALLESEGPFAVIISDMRMPEMDGVQFLSQVKETAPDSIRIMLTGNADQQTAMKAVNEGSIFRFLTKPCSLEALGKALRAGLEQYRLVMAEKELLEETLNQSLQVMVELLALVNSTAFCRTLRVKHLVRDISIQLGVPNLWELEIAAMLSQIGCITVPQEILQKVAAEHKLFPQEQQLYDAHPAITHKLIARIPRLQNVAEMIAHQNYRFNEHPASLKETSDPDLVKCCAQILKVASDFDRLVYAGKTPQAALKELQQREGWYLPVLLDMLRQVIGDEVDDDVQLKLHFSSIKPGMLLDKPLRSTRGELLLAAGQEITASLLIRLQNYAVAGLIAPEISIKSPLSLL